MPPTDQELMAGLARGDLDALRGLHERHAGLALGLALRILGDRGAAEEVVQDAFLAAWRRAATYQPGRGEPRTWLLSIVHHRAIDRLRGGAQAARRAEVELTVAEETLGTGDVWREAWQAIERQEIVRALAALPAEQREVVELAFFGGCTHVEVAERTGQPLGTVKGRIRLALQKLRTVLQGREVDQVP